MSGTFFRASIHMLQCELNSVYTENIAYVGIRGAMGKIYTPY